ncbi:ATP-binding cassette, subfamily B [Fibrobacter sp. UWCM]|uniref:ABC transporter ATP-binding protein n=1 Tax=Fibrobacter sp. UWCM TaxID=1896208 RepID=UPI0009120D1A|nr:ABC transporter ATP-binding protein [Fibrobacter sp. UWCM]SHG28821.1 ATP-binding cassette, subfamily B [Fibrobacter sp. UWCM]
MKKKSLLSWIFLFAKNKKKYYIASIFFALLRVACGIAPYIIIANIVRELLSGVRDWDVYLKECLIIAAFWFGNVLFHSISTTLSHVATFNVLGNIRKDLCDKLSRVPLGSVLDMPSGALKNILVERIDSMETTLAHVVPEFTSNLILPVLMFVYLFHIDWRMGPASLGTLPIGMVAMAVMFAGAQKWFDNSIQKTKALNDTAVEYINGIEVIKAFGKSKSSYDKFVVAAKEGSDCFVEWMRRCIWPHSLAITVAPATLLTVLPFGGYFYYNGSITAVDFITVIIISVSIMMPLLTIMSYSDDISKAGVIFGEVGSVLEMNELQRPIVDLHKPDDNSITLKNVRFSYHKGIEGEEKKEILHGIDMALPEGSFTAFVGPSGSGKSTIARLIASLWDVDSGDIEIGGVNIRDLSLEEYNRRVAYVSQDNFLFDMSVRENIRLGRPSASDAEVEEVARQSGCYKFIMSLENGFETIVGGSGAHLSGGERQRIAIARAMMKNAPIVILDEATAYTDPENEAIIQKSVAKLVQGKTLIVIAHRLSTVKDADKLYVIKDGNIDSSGTHQELLEKGGLYKSMWQAHISAKDSEEDA